MKIKWKDLTPEERKNYLGPEEPRLSAETYNDEIRTEMDRRAWNDMMSDLYHRALNSLDKHERYVLRHGHELHMGFDGDKNYIKKSRKEMAKELDIDPIHILQIRADAISKMWQFMFKPNISDISKVMEKINKNLPLD